MQGNAASWQRSSLFGVLTLRPEAVIFTVTSLTRVELVGQPERVIGNGSIGQPLSLEVLIPIIAMNRQAIAEKDREAIVAFELSSSQRSFLVG